MNKKMTTSAIRISLILTGLLGIGACSFFNGASWNHKAVSAQEARKFVGSIRPLRGDAVSHYALAEYFQERKKHPLAIDEFETVLEIDPGNVKAYNGMGVSFALMGDYERAVESYQAALNIKPDLDYVLNNLGYAYLLQGRLDEAIDGFRRAITVNDGNPRYHNNLGVAYAKKGQVDLAFEAFSRAGGEARARHNLARILHPSAGSPSDRPEPRVPDTDDRISVEPIIAAGGESKTETVPAEPELEFKNPPVVQPAGQGGSSMDSESDTTKAVSVDMMEADPADFSPKALSHRIVIEVSNGNGVNKMARKVGNYLNKEGFKFMYVMNADHFDHPVTTIYYRTGFFEEACMAAHLLPGRQRIKEVASLRWEEAKMKVLIGKDLIPHLPMFLVGGRRSGENFAIRATGPNPRAAD